MSQGAFAAGWQASPGLLTSEYILEDAETLKSLGVSSCFQSQTWLTTGKDSSLGGHSFLVFPKRIVNSTAAGRSLLSALITQQVQVHGLDA